MSRTKRLGAMLAVALLAGAATPATLYAQNGNGKDDGPPKISEVVEGKEKRDGYLTLWVDEKKNELHAEVPAKVIGQEFLVATSISSGQLAGLQASDLLLKFEKQDDSLLLVQPNIFYTASGDLKEVVEYTYPDEVLGKTKILGQDPNGNVLIDLKALLSEQTPEFVGRMPGSIFTQVARARSYENNSVVELRFRGKTGTTGVYFNIGNLPSTGYKPRVADPRIGYFLTAQQDFSKPDNADTTFDRFINRWHLEKVDPSLSLSPPKEPIVIYIEDTVPVKYRRWVREGIESWNEAFEEIGFSNAIEVRQQTDNSFADLEPEDSRYNFFRWITSQRAFAIAPSRVNPRTGQILDSDILFDEAMVRYYLQDYDLYVGGVPEARDLSPRTRHWLARNPQEHPLWPELEASYSLRIEQEPAIAGLTPQELFARDLTVHEAGAFHTHTIDGQCNIGAHLTQELGLAAMGLEFGLWSQEAAEDSGSSDGSEDEEKKEGEEENKDDEAKNGKKVDLDEWPEEFIGPLVREIVAHEFGHTLGLRHNFKASSWKTWDEIVNATDPTAPTSGSVMDYNPFILKADGTMPEVWVTPNIGPYDKWAVQYGYAVAGSGDLPSDEKKMLDQITDRVAEDGLAYGTDEDTSSPDPLIKRWDMAKDSLSFYEARVELSDKIMSGLIEAIVDEDESYAKAREAYMILLGQRFLAANAAANYIGGYDLNRYHKGDPDAGAPIQVTDAAEQRRALNMITDVLFAPDAIKLEPEIQNYLTAPRWYHQGSMDWLTPILPSTQDRVLAFQKRVLFTLTNPDRLGYLYDAEFHAKPEDELLTLPEMMNSLTTNIWAELDDSRALGRKHTAREPMISTLRRNLQREYASRLINIATQPEDTIYPAVARTMARSELRTLSGKIDGITSGGDADNLDPYTLAHLDETSARIQKALDANFTIGGNRGGGSIILMLGQDTPGDAAFTMPENY